MENFKDNHFKVTEKERLKDTMFMKPWFIKGLTEGIKILQLFWFYDLAI